MVYSVSKLKPRIALGQEVIEPEAEVEIICMLRQCVQTVMSSQDMPKQASKQTLKTYKHMWGRPGKMYANKVEMIA